MKLRVTTCEKMMYGRNTCAVPRCARTHSEKFSAGLVKLKVATCEKMMYGRHTCAVPRSTVPEAFSKNLRRTSETQSGYM